jgi:hypothetical protein
MGLLSASLIAEVLVLRGDCETEVADSTQTHQGREPRSAGIASDGHFNAVGTFSLFCDDQSRVRVAS